MLSVKGFDLSSTAFHGDFGVRFLGAEEIGQVYEIAVAQARAAQEAEQGQSVHVASDERIVGNV
jgi:hypothetical protein